MKIQVFALRDLKSNQFGSPLFLQNVQVCLRSLSDEVNSGDSSSLVRQHPEDFELYHLGEWDPQTARFELFADPRSIVLAGTLKQGAS